MTVPGGKPGSLGERRGGELTNRACELSISGLFFGCNEATVVREARSVPITFADTMKAQRDVNQGLAGDFTLPSDPGEARRIQEEIEQLLHARRVNEHDIFSIKLALEEALVNAIKHGNQMDRGKKVRIVYQLLPDRFEVQITDDGNGFDPGDVPDPTAFENLERPCGRGLMLMRHYMTEVSFSARGNTVTMSKVFRTAPSSNGKK
jgi:serine/threonine-protein kinase RsbW